MPAYVCHVMRVHPGVEECALDNGCTCVQNTLWALDLSEMSPLLPALVHPALLPLRTTYEGNFGTPVLDVYFFPAGVSDPGISASDRLFCYPRVTSVI